jgi:hypothetical protein
MITGDEYITITIQRGKKKLSRTYSVMESLASKQESIVHLGNLDMLISEWNIYEDEIELDDA